jgi:glutathione S-transferase
MKLYWCPRSRSITALWMLEEFGQPYERVKIDITTGQQKSDAYRAVNPMMKVPALADGEALVAETGAIAAYLIEKFPQSGLAPAQNDPARGRFWQWLFYSGNCIEPSIAQTFLKFETSPMSIAWGSAEIVFNTLEQELGSRPYILGEHFSAADILIASYLNFAIRLFKILPMRPAFEAYLERCTSRPAFLRAMAIEEAG